MNLNDAIAHLRLEPNIKGLIDQIDAFEMKVSNKIYFNLLESIVSQQLSVKVADVIFARFLTLFPDQYPDPDKLLALDIEILRGVGLSYQKANYLQNVARFSLEHQIEHKQWDSMSDDEIIAFLTQIKGVGKWTVEMLLMFTFGRLDILPVDDLGIQQGMIKLFDLDASNPKLLKQKMIEMAEPWRPYRTVASRYIWRYKDTV